MKDEIKIIKVGQVSNQGSQSGMVYDTNGLFPTVCACTHGYAMGNIVEYIKNNTKEEDDVNMWKNELTKYDFLMEELRIADFFCGIGALHQSLKDLGVPNKIQFVSEIDVDATISYAAGHIENFKDIEIEYPSDDEMRKWLMDRNIGYSYEKDKSSIPRMKKDKLRIVYKANLLLNNLGDISKIDYDEIPDFDLMNFSFSCTDLSNSGKQRGMRNPDGTPTRSGLYVYGMKAIRVKKPKYIMIENVKGLIQKKFIDDFYSIIEELEEIGYNCYYPTKEDKKGNKSPMCLNAKHFGIPQNRERIFVICVRKDVDNGNFKFPEGRDYGVRLKDVLEDSIEDKYYLSQEIQDRFKLNGRSDEDRNELNVVGSSAPEYRTIGQRDMTYGVNGVMSTLTATDYKQPKQIIENGAIRGRYNEDGKIEQRLELRDDGVTNTLTTVEEDNVVVEHRLNKDFFVDMKGRCQYFEEKANYIQWDVSGKGYASQQDRAFYEDGNIGTIPAANTSNKVNVVENINNEFRIRKLTPKECWRLQGFKDDNFDRAKEMGISDSSLYKQAGNSIVVNVLHAIFKNLFEDYII